MKYCLYFTRIFPSAPWNSEEESYADGGEFDIEAWCDRVALQKVQEFVSRELEDCGDKIMSERLVHKFQFRNIKFTRVVKEWNWRWSSVNK